MKKFFILGTLAISAVSFAKTITQDNHGMGASGCNPTPEMIKLMEANGMMKNGVHIKMNGNSMMPGTHQSHQILVPDPKIKK